MNFTLLRSKSVIYKEKRSEFIGFAEPISAVQDINDFKKTLKSKYPSAKHICWAYRIFIDSHIVENSTDSGEPSGSAGLQILNVLKQNNLVNCSIFVVRIFGGVKLGKQGLSKAYKITAEKVITESVQIKLIHKMIYQIWTPIKYFGNITHLLQRNAGTIISDLTIGELNLLVKIPIDNYDKFKVGFDKITQNSGVIKKQSEHDQTKEVRK